MRNPLARFGIIKNGSVNSHSHNKKMEKEYICCNCWWSHICRRTKQACKEIQEIDMRWTESPNHRFRQ